MNSLTKRVTDDLIRWLCQRPSERLSVDILAQRSGYSKWHLHRFIKAHTGGAPWVFLKNLRHSYAAIALLETHDKVIFVALNADYDSRCFFTRDFQRHFGITPGGVRKLSGEEKQIYRRKVTELFAGHNSGLEELLVTARSGEITIERRVKRHD